MDNLTRQQLRQSGRELKKTMKNYNDHQFYMCFVDVYNQAAKDSMKLMEEIIEKTMKEDFGFGEKRLDKLNEGMNRRLKGMSE